MNMNRQLIKATLVLGSILIISVLHYSVTKSDLGMHYIHRELFFIPILLASFWFGLKVGIATAIVVNILYVHHLFFYAGAHEHGLVIGLQISVFLIAGALLGYLVDRQKKEYRMRLRSENLMILGRAASTIGYEIKNVSGALKSILLAHDSPADEKSIQSIKAELQNLDNIASVLQSFLASEAVKPMSHDLNALIRKRVDSFQTEARKKEFEITVELSSDDCLANMDPERINTVIDSLVRNAVDVTKTGQRITITSVCGIQTSQFSVIDQGPGIKPENLTKLFTPFFTTKPDGQGLALAVCKRIIGDLGGTIDVRSEYGHGAEFIVTIPRGLDSKSIKAHV